MKWNTGLYDNKHNFVSKYGEDVVALLQPQPGERVLDVGCGTGDLAALIAESGAHVEGIDASKEMIATAKQKFPALTFDIADIITYRKPAFYDAVFSNATLHWVTEKVPAVVSIYENLKPRGRFVAEFGGKDNVLEIVNAICTTLASHHIPVKPVDKLWYFPSIGGYTSVLESVGFRVEYAVHFDRETELASTDNGIKDWIKMFGSYYFEGLDAATTESLLDKIQEALKPGRFYNNKWHADYKRIRVVARKP